MATVEHDSLLGGRMASSQRQTRRADPDAANEGLSLARLKRVAQYVQRQVDEGRAPMMQLAIARRGKVVFTASAGLADRQRGTPLTDTTIMRMFSNTKMVVSVAAMILIERAQLHLDKPVEEYLPCFAATQVYVRTEGDRVLTRPPARKMTVHDLLRHTSGITYGFMPGPVGKLYRDAGISFDARVDIGLGLGSETPDTPGALMRMVERLAALPLVCDPGAAFNYSHSTDVLGCVLEVASGRLLPDLLRDEVLAPLDMVDTAFFVRPDAASRLAALYRFDAASEDTFVRADDPATSANLTPRRHLCGGGSGLLSTLRDFTRFMLMLGGGGAYDGVRLLSRKSVAFMMCNHLPPGVTVTGPDGAPGFLHCREGMGFGLGGSVCLDPARNQCLGSVGQWSWGGAANTYVNVDPQEELSFVMLTQVTPSFSLCQWRRDLQTLIEACLVD